MRGYMAVSHICLYIYEECIYFTRVLHKMCTAYISICTYIHTYQTTPIHNHLLPLLTITKRETPKFTAKTSKKKPKKKTKINKLKLKQIPKV